jgi:hypothetical protein
VFLQRVAERELGMNNVAVPAAYPFGRDIAVCFQIRHNPLRGTLRDADLFCHVTKADLGVSCNAQQNVRMVRQKCPLLHPEGYYTTSKTRLSKDDLYIVYFNS